jgi:dTDP-4-dehydrorhamnose reductase
VIVNAAAHTAVDQAEAEPELAERINGAGAGAIAAAAARLGVPVIQLSTDYVFDGAKPAPYVESDAVGPVGAYGRSKLAGERAVAAANPDHVILRTAWVYAPQGKNFVRTMLRLAASRPELSVVADQHGCPSYAPDIADAVIAVARRLRSEPDNPALRGVFHLSGTGHTDWASFAAAIFAASAHRGGPSAKVRRIATMDYPTPAKRPANSRLDCGKLKAAYGIAMPPWRDALARCMDELAQRGELSAS